MVGFLEQVRDRFALGVALAAVTMGSRVFRRGFCSFKQVAVAWPSLRASIECVLLDHAGELDGELVDANLAELAHVYQELTGFNVAHELEKDGIHG